MLFEPLISVMSFCVVVVVILPYGNLEAEQGAQGGDRNSTG